MALPVVVIVGRPNVGKSTLFNRLVGFKKAVVHDRPGVTRDRLYEEADILGREVLAVDTGGIEPDQNTDLLTAMRQQSLVAVEEADVIIFVVDGRAGITPADKDVMDVLRKSEKPVILAVNKVDGPKHAGLVNEFWALGLTPLLPVSAEHGGGVYELCEAVCDALPEPETSEEFVEDDEGEEAVFDGVIRIAVIGRPNIGKSTLINQLLGVERHLVHDSPGTTMDAVDSKLTVGDKEYLLVDTAGVRKRSRIGDPLERYVSLRSIRAIERCHVSLLLIDATEGPTDQDAKLAQLVADRGRALIILINKWDMVKGMEDVNSASVGEALIQRLPHAHWAPHLFIAAINGKGVHRILPAVEQAFTSFNRRITTAKLNKWLEYTLEAHAPPQRHHRPVRLYYVAQNRVRPPTFVFFANTPEAIAKPYQRYLSNRLRESFELYGSPVRMVFKRRRKLGEGRE
jgi:GTP-binding protein